MARLKVRGAELRVKTLSTAKVTSVIELQQQSGMKLGDLHKAVQQADVYGAIITSFLTQRDAGLEPKWHAMLEANLEDAGTFIKEPGDEPAPAPEEEPEADPTEGVSATVEPAADAPQATTTDGLTSTP